MGLFDGSGGDFDPSNWVDMQVYNEVMKDNGDSHQYSSRTSKKSKTSNNVSFKPIHIIAWVGFLIIMAIKVDIGNHYKYPAQMPFGIEIAFTIIPIVWLLLIYFGGILFLIIRGKKLPKVKENNDLNKEKKGD